MAKKEKRPATLDIDWRKISSEYITSDKNISAKALAQKYDLPQITVEKRCALDGWVAKRAAYRERIVQRSLKKAEDKEVNKLSHLLCAADNISRTINRISKDEKQFNRRLIERADGELEERIYEKVDSKALRDLTASIKDMVAVMQALYGDPNKLEADSNEGGVIVLAEVDADDE